MEQTEGIYKELMRASTYAQVLSTLNHFKGDNVTKVQKIDNSMKLIDVSNITELQKNK